MIPNLGLFLALGLVASICLPASVKILAEHERGVIIRLGRVPPQPKGPGILLLFPPMDRMVRVSRRETGVAETDLNPEGKVKVRGESWDAGSSTRVRQGRRHFPAFRPF